MIEEGVLGVRDQGVYLMEDSEPSQDDMRRIAKKMIYRCEGQAMIRHRQMHCRQWQDRQQKQQRKPNYDPNDEKSFLKPAYPTTVARKIRIIELVRSRAGQ